MMSNYLNMSILEKFIKILIPRRINLAMPHSNAKIISFLFPTYKTSNNYRSKI